MMLARFSVQKQAMLLRHSASSMQRGSLLCPSPVTSSSRCTQMTRKFEPINTRSFFTKSSAKNSKSNKEKPKWSDRWRRLAKVVKYIRIPAIVGSVYMLGYQQGIMESFRNPRLMEDQILSAILKDVGCNSKDQVTIFASNDVPTMPLSKSAMLQAKTLRIGNDIIRSASKYVRDELHNAIKNVRQKAPPDIPDEELRVICDIDSDVIFWRSALFRIEGEDPNIPWKYFIAKSPVANAFVTEILPQRLFITTAMFESFIENEDELAVVLGHEVAHLVLGHVSQRNALERMLRTLEVLLLSIDPTEGLVSLGVIGGLMWMRRILMASFSRDHELEADELGLKIAAMACYNTKRGSYVMKKMHDEAIKLAGEPTHYSNVLTMLDTHPPSLDRYNKLVEQCQYEHSGLYPERCAQIHERLLRAVWK